MSVVIALANQKGGVGKTTTTVSLAAALGAQGLRVLIVDADPQANATSALAATRPEGLGLYDALVDEHPLHDSVVPTKAEGVSIIPTTPALAGAEVELVAMMAREFRMRRALEPLREHFDLMLIDCPPSLGLITVNALAASDEVIIPVQCEYFALEGLGHLSHTIELVTRNLNPKLVVRGVLLTMYDARTNLSREVEEEVRRHFPNTFRAVIPRSVRLAEAPSHGEPIHTYDPYSPGARAYDQLARELTAQLGSALTVSAGGSLTAAPVDAPGAEDDPMADEAPEQAVSEAASSPAQHDATERRYTEQPAEHHDEWAGEADPEPGAAQAQPSRPVFAQPLKREIEPSAPDTVDQGPGTASAAQDGPPWTVAGPERLPAAAADMVADESPPFVARPGGPAPAHHPWSLATDTTSDADGGGDGTLDEEGLLLRPGSRGHAVFGPPPDPAEDLADTSHDPASPHTGPPGHGAPSHPAPPGRSASVGSEESHDA